MTQPSHVTGPIGCYHYYHPQLQTEIYLFSDQHGTNDHHYCPHASPISTLISGIIQDHPQLHFDVVLESPVLMTGGIEQTPDLYSHRSFIQDVVIELEQCLISLSAHRASNDDRQRGRACRRPNLTVHPCDFRINRPIDLWYRLLELLGEGYSQATPLELLLTDLTSIRRQLQQIVNNSQNTLSPLQLIAQLYGVGQVITEQYQWVERSLRVTIEEFLRSRLDHLIVGGSNEIITSLLRFEKQLSTEINKGKQAVVKLSWRVREQLADELRSYIEAETWLLEYYSFARMFSTYEGRGRPHNIIYYAGYYHTESTRDLLEWLGFEELAAVESSAQCLPLTQLHPWFPLNNK